MVAEHLCSPHAFAFTPPKCVGMEETEELRYYYDGTNYCIRATHSLLL